jgi:hypothetical protein
VFGGDVFVGDLALLQVGKGEGKCFDEVFDVVEGEEFIGVQSVFEQLFEGGIHVLEEEYFVFGLDFDGVFEGRGLQFEQSFAVGSGESVEYPGGFVGGGNSGRSAGRGGDSVAFWFAVLLAHLTNI